MKRATWNRILAVLLSVILLLLGSGLGSFAYNLPSGYTLSNSYKAGKYYKQLAAVTLTGDQRTDIAAIAVSQIGYHEGSKGVFSGYGSGSGNYSEYTRYAYNSTGYAAWCGTFVSWCAAMAGIPTTILPKTASAKPIYWKMCGSSALTGASVKTPENLVTNGGTYIPQVGDLAFFGSKSTGDALKNSCSHVGLIIEVNLTYSGSKIAEIEVVTAEGNYSDKVTRNEYVFNASERNGHAYGSTYLNTFGVPNYTSKSVDNNVGNTETAYNSIDIGAYGGTYLRTTTEVCDAVRKLQMGLNLVSLLNDEITLPIVAVDGSFGTTTLKAVKAFQTAEGLDVDGVVGKDTWNALRSEVTSLTGSEKSDYIVSDGKLYAYKGMETAVTVPDDVTVIGADAFSYYSYVVSVKIPASVKSVEQGAFSACTPLKTVMYDGTASAYASLNIASGNSLLTGAEVIYSKVTVTFRSGETEMDVVVNTGSVPTVPDGIVTEKAGDALYSYAFAGWKMGQNVYDVLPSVDADCVFVAEYTVEERILNVETLNALLVVLASGAEGDITLYDYTADGILNVADLNALLVLLATSQN